MYITSCSAAADSRRAHSGTAHTRARTRAYGHRHVGFVAKEGDAGFPALFGCIFIFYFFKWCTQTPVVLGQRGFFKRHYKYSCFLFFSGASIACAVRRRVPRKGTPMGAPHRVAQGQLPEVPELTSHPSPLVSVPPPSGVSTPPYLLSAPHPRVDPPPEPRFQRLLFRYGILFCKQ